MYSFLLNTLCVLQLGLFPLHQAILRTDPAERNRLVSKLLDKGADVSARAVDVRSFRI